MCNIFDHMRSPGMLEIDVDMCCMSMTNNSAGLDILIFNLVSNDDN